MNIGLISDTHIPEAMPVLPSQVRQVFAGVDLILHAGDLHCLDVLDWLETMAPVRAARGNGDNGSGGRPLVPDDPRLQETQLLACNGWTLGMVHDVLDPTEMPHWPIERTMQHYLAAAQISLSVATRTWSGSSATGISGSSILAAQRFPIISLHSRARWVCSLSPRARGHKSPSTTSKLVHRCQDFQ